METAILIYNIFQKIKNKNTCNKLKYAFSVDENGRDFNELVEYLDSPELIYQFYFDEKRIENVIKRYKN